MMKEITSRENAEVRRYTLLASSRKERREMGLFVTEGWKLAAEAFQSGYACTALYATKSALEKYPLISSFGSVTLISDSVSEKLASAVTPQGVFGVFVLPEEKEICLSAEGKYLLLDGLQDPGNIGTILRTSAALGVSGVFLSPDTPDPFSLKVLRASMGGVFRLPMQTKETKQTIATLQEIGLPVWAAALDHRAVSLREAALGACGVIVGNEGSGLKAETVSWCDGTVMIPMIPGNESLNAAMAAGILLWEMTK